MGWAADAQSYKRKADNWESFSLSVLTFHLTARKCHMDQRGKLPLSHEWEQGDLHQVNPDCDLQ